MLTAASAPLRLSCEWTIKENGIAVLQRKNVFTNYGLSALASALQGSYVAPVYLVLETSHTNIVGSVAIGATSVSLSSRIDQTGDTQLVLSAGTAAQETVTFSSVSGTTYTLSSPCTFAHANNDVAVRQVKQSDTLSNVLSELQYDAVNAPGQRLVSLAGYSTGVGQWTIQFYLTATMATGYIAAVGLTDNLTIGQGNLHNHVVLGYDHSSGANDVEIDGTLTITN